MSGTPLRPVVSGLTKKFSPGRRRIYLLLIATPGRAWTVGEFVLALARLAPTSPELVRSTLYLLATDRIVEVVPRGPALTFVLTDPGAALIRKILASWQAAGRRVPHPRSRGRGTDQHRFGDLIAATGQEAPHRNER
jgi:hypothetical protein